MKKPHTHTHTRTRTPRNYDGTLPTTRRVTDLLPSVLSAINNVYSQRPDLILAAWPDIIGQKLAPMAQAVSFTDGVLLVRVKNSTLHSLLSQNEKGKILNILKQKFPNANIKNIYFRMG